jgi:hypothetical protein
MVRMGTQTIDRPDVDIKERPKPNRVIRTNSVFRKETMKKPNALRQKISKPNYVVLQQIRSRM